MKTAASIPDDIFERAERLARRRHRSRSEAYAAALDEHVARHVRDEVTDAMNRACRRVGGESDGFLAAAGRRILARISHQFSELEFSEPRGESNISLIIKWKIEFIVSASNPTLTFCHQTESGFIQMTAHPRVAPDG